MQKAHDSSYNNYWRNYPNVSTPIVQDQLNRNETTVDTIDDRVVAMDTTKANQTDLLQTISGVTFDASTGTFTFTKSNGTTIVIDTDIEKIPVNFNYDDDPTSAHYQQLILTLDDGTVKYVDMSALVTQYEFNDSSAIHFTILNGVITASIISGSITEDLLQPNFLADCRAEVNAAVAEVYNAEAWAKGTKNGIPVSSDDVTYNNNSRYYSEVADDESQEAEAWARGTKNGMLVPASSAQYHNNSQYYAERSHDYSFDSEAYAIGKRNGENVPIYDVAYNNNSKHYAQKAQQSVSQIGNVVGQCEDIKTEVEQLLATTTVYFTVNFTTGELIYSNEDSFNFEINETTGELEWEVV